MLYCGWITIIKVCREGKGRKISKSLAIYDPSISELREAAISLGYDISPDQLNDTARFPRRPHIKSGYIMISKNRLNEKQNNKKYS